MELLFAMLLGIQHGCDADHIAVVDGMTRTRQFDGVRTSRFIGAQFPAGHGLVILAGSLMLQIYSVPVPGWLDGVGLWVSTGLLVLVGTRNLVHALGGEAFRRRRLTVVFRFVAGRRMPPALLGMAFALSFDAMTQALVFAGHGSRSGVPLVFAMAMAFGFGMVLMDATAGAMLSWLGSAGARQASRVLSGFVGVVALGTAAVRLFPHLPVCGRVSLEQCGVWPGVWLVLVTLVVCLSSNLLLRRRT